MSIITSLLRREMPRPGDLGGTQQNIVGGTPAVPPPGLFRNNAAPPPGLFKGTPPLVGAPPANLPMGPGRSGRIAPPSALPGFGVDTLIQEYLRRRGTPPGG